MTQTLKKVGNYKFIRKIGSGATSEVFEGRKEGQLDRYAIKMIKIKSMSKQQREMIAKEVIIIKSISHSHIVKLHETLQTSNHYYLIFQFCEKGDLQKYLKQNLGTLLTLDNVKKIISCIAQAVQHLHNKGIAHRDIKLANILLKKDCTIKLADFGFAKESNSEEVMMRTYCGTPITMAPEILKGKPYDKKCDIWSLGVILFQLTFGKLPFPIDQGYAVFADKVANQKVKIPSTPQIPASLVQLIYHCLEANQTKRYSIDEFLQSPWMQEQSQVVIKQEKPENINEVLKKAAKQNKIIQYSQEQFEINKSISIFQKLLAYRVCNILNVELTKIINRHIFLRKQILKLTENNKELYRSLVYYDKLILKKWQQKLIKVRYQGQSESLVPIKALKNIKFPENIGEEDVEPVQIGAVLMNYLKELSKMQIDLQKKKNRYYLVMNFLDLVQNFQLEVTLFFNNCYQIQFSLQNLTEFIIENQISLQDSQDYHKGLNHITIALQCRQKDERFRQAANSLKSNCQKRIDDIQRQINGY